MRWPPQKDFFSTRLRLDKRSKYWQYTNMLKRKKWLLISLFLAIGSLSLAQEDKPYFEKHFRWTANLRAKGLLEKKHGYRWSRNSLCFFDDKGNLKGIHKNLPLRIASVSKVYTSYWALKKLGSNHRFKTSVYYDDGDLYIQGDDLLFNREHLYKIIENLNKKGIKTLRNIYFSPEFFWASRNSLGDWGKIRKGGEHFLSRVRKIFDLRNSQFRSYFQSYKRWGGPIQELSPVLFENIDYKDSHFLEGALLFSLESKPLVTYLKMMNTRSHNSLADLLFEGLGGMERFHDFIYGELNTDERSLFFVTGSGLDANTTVGRRDNYSTCELTLEMMRKLESETGVFLSEILAFSARQEGTLEGRFKGRKKLSQSVVAKTGTLGAMPVVSLAGSFKSLEKEHLFVMINQTLYRGKSLIRGREFQEIMLEKLGQLFRPKAYENLPLEEVFALDEIGSELLLH